MCLTFDYIIFLSPLHCSSHTACWIDSVAHGTQHFWMFQRDESAFFLQFTQCFRSSMPIFLLYKNPGDVITSRTVIRSLWTESLGGNTAIIWPINITCEGRKGIPAQCKLARPTCVPRAAAKGILLISWSSPDWLCPSPYLRCYFLSFEGSSKTPCSWHVIPGVDSQRNLGW